MRSASALRALVLTTSLAVVAVRAPAPARAADDPEAADAKRHYEEGTKAFNLGEYPRAITEFKATYNAKPDPLLLYNIAQSYRLQGDAGLALFFYKSFLRNMPAATNRKEVEGKIKVLEKQVADQKKDAVTPAPGAAVVPPPAASPGAETTAATPAPPATSPAPAPAPASPPTAAAAPAEPRIGLTGGEAASGAAATTLPTAPPPVPSPAMPATVDLTTPAQPAEPADRPIYKKWWFWAGSAAVVLVIVGVGAAAASSHKAPSTPLGIYVPTFM